MISEIVAGATSEALVNGIMKALVEAGWTATGSNGDWRMTNCARHPGGPQACVRISAGPNCAQIAGILLGAESISTNHDFLLRTGVLWRLHASAYQFHISQFTIERGSRWRWSRHWVLAAVIASALGIIALLIWVVVR